MGDICPHKNTELLITGGMHFAAGEVWDDIREEVYCLDCHQTLDENQLKQNGEHALRQGKYLLWRDRRSRAYAQNWREKTCRLGNSLDRLKALKSISIDQPIDGQHDGIF